MFFTLSKNESMIIACGAQLICRGMELSTIMINQEFALLLMLDREALNEFFVI